MDKKKPGKARMLAGAVAVALVFTAISYVATAGAMWVVLWGFGVESIWSWRLALGVWAVFAILSSSIVALTKAGRGTHA